MKKSSNKGFTLVELIIVIAILAIIMLIAIPNFSGIQQRMQVRADKATAAQIGKAVRVWFTDYTTDSNLGVGASGTVLPSALVAPTAAGSVALVDYSTLDGISNYITPNYRATSLKKTDKTTYDDDTDATNGTGGYYGIFLTAGPTDASAKIAVAIISKAAPTGGGDPVITTTNISGITGTDAPFKVEVSYNGEMSDTSNGGVAYVEP